MHQHDQAKRQAYIGPELILYGRLDTITSGNDVPTNCTNFITKVGSSPDDLVYADVNLHGDWTCL